MRSGGGGAWRAVAAAAQDERDEMDVLERRIKNRSAEEIPARVGGRLRALSKNTQEILVWSVQLATIDEYQGPL